MTKTKNTNFILLALLSFLAVLDHTYLAYQHYALKLGLDHGKSLCNISDKFNCDAVSLSSYSIFLNLPVAVWGGIANLILFGLILIGWIGLSQNPPRLLRLTFLLGTLIALVSILMGSISTFVLKTYCLFCIAAYILSFVIWFFLFKANDSDLKGFLSDIKSLFTDHRWVGVFFLLIPVGTYLANSIMLDSYGFGQSQIFMQESLANWKETPEQKFDLSKGLSQQNSENVKMTVIEFADYLCPHCKGAASSMRAFINSHPGTRLIFKSFPLDGVCNKDLKRQGDGLRCQLAYTSFCAEKIANQGWTAHHWIFERQESLSSSGFEADLKALSEQIKVPYDQMKACIDSDEIHELISAQAKEGAAAGIPGTPAIFVNNKRLENGQFLPLLQKVYDEIQ